MLEKILHFLQISGMSRTRFSYECMGDPAFITKLERGRELRPKAVKRIEKFIKERSAK
jgi:hypothetical protein